MFSRAPGRPEGIRGIHMQSSGHRGVDTALAQFTSNEELGWEGGRITDTFAQESAQGCTLSCTLRYWQLEIDVVMAQGNASKLKLLTRTAIVCKCQGRWLYVFFFFGKDPRQQSRGAGRDLCHRVVCAGLAEIEDDSLFFNLQTHRTKKV